jgi:hypothetical protein
MFTWSLWNEPAKYFISHVINTVELHSSSNIEILVG